MSLQWPWLLLSLAAIPVLAQAYRRLLARRAARREVLAGLGLVPLQASGPGAASPRQDAPGRWGAVSRRGALRRHLPPVLFLVALTLLCVALARPQASLAQARREGTVVLAFDTSGSMAATDLPAGDGGATDPGSRMDAAKAAARAFVTRQPGTIRVGVVAFGESALITQQPTTDRARVLAAIDRLAPQGGTALGRGIQTALSAIAGRPVQLDDGSGASTGTGSGSSTGTGTGAGGSSPQPSAAPAPLGFYGSAAVILLSDGENTSGPDPVEVAEIASAAGVRIYPVGLGDPRGTVLTIDGFQVATALDEAALRSIASVTDGTYFTAADQESLTRVYTSIDLAWAVRRDSVEVTALFAGAAALLLLTAAGLSFVWFRRVI